MAKSNMDQDILKVLFSEQEIHTLNDFKDAAAASLYAFWFGEDAVTEDMGDISETSDVSSGRLYFETSKSHPIELKGEKICLSVKSADANSMLLKSVIIFLATTEKAG